MNGHRAAPSVPLVLAGGAAALAAALLLPIRMAAQAPAHLTISVSASGRPVSGAEVRSQGKTALSGADGGASLDLDPGANRVTVWKVGFAVDTLAVTLRAGEDTTLFAHLTVAPEELAPIVVRATRTETRIEEVPERVEVLAPEDVDEKSLTSPGSLTNLLVEMGGIRMQAVAPGLGGATPRVQGLPGRYTLVLSDGLPLYGNQLPSFSLAQIPPLDLQQAEVIKGAETALYGPSALGGVVDLVSKRPAHDRRALVSGSSRGGGDGLLWISRALSPRWGYTLLGGVHGQERRDVNQDGWADLPGYRRIEARPRLFWSGAGGSSLMMTVGGTAEDRKGGTVPGATVPSGLPFPEKLDTRHLDAGASGHLVLSPSAFVGIRASGSLTHHARSFGSEAEQDRRSTLFLEGTLSATGSRHSAVLGASIQRDAFRQAERPAFDFGYNTASLFAQDTYTPVAPLSLQGSARLDRHSRYGTFLSPRLSALVRLAPGWSVRASAGTGFFAPTPLITEVEETGFALVVPPDSLRAERGRSASLDVGGTLGPFQLNATLFAARVRGPVLPSPIPGDSIRYTLENAPGPIRTSGAEIFAVYAWEPFLVTATFSHTVATELNLEEGRRIEVPLTPRNSGGVDAAYEEDDPGESGVRVALEVFRTGRQRVVDDPYRSETPAFTTVELLASKQLGRFLVFANGEYLTGVRQTRWDPLLLPSPGLGGRWTTDEWAPLEGRSVNVGAQVSF